MINPSADSYSQGSSKTWGKDLQSLMDDFPDIRAELTPSRTFSWSDDHSHRLLYSCNGGYSIFIDDNFQNAQEACKEGIRSFLNEAGIDYIVSTPEFHKTWFRVSIMLSYCDSARHVIGNPASRNNAHYRNKSQEIWLR